MASSVSLEEENIALKARIIELETELARYRAAAPTAETDDSPATPPPVTTSDNEAPPQDLSPSTTTLTADEYKRYGRQMILNDIGLPGQLLLKRSRILLVGLGGLGCPSSLYLSAAGIGTLGLLDHDTVDMSNLHRQILHTSQSVGQLKVHSAATTLRRQNPGTNIITHPYALSPSNAVETVHGYDLVLDCTDHPAVRYLLSDACVVAGRPLVSASALRMDGQLVVLNSPPGVGPCYRCVWPTPPPAASVTSCGEGGVLGAVVGTMGVVQALEALKVLLGLGGNGEKGRLLMLNAGGRGETGWRSIKMRGRKEGCVACGSGGMTEDKIKAGDYVTFCGGVPAPEHQLKREDRVMAEEARGVEGVTWVDVRDETQFGICSMRESVNVPFEEWMQTVAGELPAKMVEVLGEGGIEGAKGKKKKVYMLCRVGNDSQVTTRRVMESEWGKRGEVEVRDVVGGVMEWARRYPGDGLVEY